MPLLRKVNLWPRLVVGVSLGFLVLFAVLSLLILRVVDDSRDRIFQERLLIAQITARQVDSVLENAFADLQDAAAVVPLPAQEAGSDRTSQELARILEGADRWLGLYVLDSGGHAAAAAPAAGAQAAADLMDDPGIRSALAEGREGVSTPYVDGAAGRPAVMLTIPLAGSGAGAGFVLAAVLDLSHADLLRPLNDARSLGETGHAELVDGRGLVIAATDAAPFLAPGEHRSFYLRMLNSGREGVETVPYELRNAEEAQQEGDRHIMAIAHLSNASWEVAVGGDEAETLAPVTDLRNKMLVLGAASLVVLWLVTLVSARLLVRPVRVLTAAADRIGAGDLESPIRVAEGGEIGRLGETLEAMRLRLRASLEEISRWGKELEGKVAERTQELHARNRELTALTAVATAANESRSLDQMLERCLEIVLEHTEMEVGAVRLFEGEDGRLVAASQRDAFSQSPCPERAADPDRCLCWRVASSGQPLVGRPAALHPPAGHPCLAPHYDLVAVLPLTSPKGVQGVLYLAKRRGDALDTRHTEMLTVMCNQIGVAIENARLFQDLTKMETQREMDRLKSEFMSAVSHELRTPLGFIKGYVTTLLREDLIADPETQREFLQIISEESDKLQKLIDDLLDASRVHYGGLTLSRTPARVGRIVKQAVEKLRTAFPGQDFRLDLPRREPEVLVDPWRIEQVIQNLVDNAVKYSPPGSPVSIGVWLAGPEMVTSVTDRGDGIPEQDSRLIFEPFHRGRGATDRSPGTGLGLTICRGIVEAHGGRIWLESKPGSGSTFHFALPLAPRGLGPGRPGSGPARVPRTARKTTRQAPDPDGVSTARGPAPAPPRRKRGGDL